MIILILPFLCIGSACGAENPTKKQDVDLLEVVNRLETMYRQCIDMGMQPKVAAKRALLWYESIYPSPKPKEEEKKEKDKGD